MTSLAQDGIDRERYGPMASCQAADDLDPEERPVRLTAIMAHPDDAEIWAGGTICKHVERGDEALIICMVADEASLRGMEATRGAAILGAQLACVGLADGQVRDTPETCERVSDLLRRFAPDLLMTHWVDDVHADHATTAAIVQRVLPSVMSQMQKAPRWWACDTYFSMGTRGAFVPDVFIDVTAQWPRKLAAIRAHQSQRPDAWIRLTERQCGLHGQRYTPPDTPPAPFYAEGFKRVIPFGYLAPVAYLDS